MEARLPSVGSTTRASKASVFFARTSVCLKKKAIFLCEGPPLFFDSGRFRQHFGQAAQFPIFQRIAWFYTADDGAHCKVRVHFEEFVSHIRCQTLAAELQNGISKIFSGEIQFLNRSVDL